MKSQWYLLGKSALLTACRSNIRQCFDSAFPLHNFHHIEDMRSIRSLSDLKQNTTGGVDFDVVLLQNSLHFSTHETQPILLARLLTLLAPGGRLVIDWRLPSSLRLHIRGKIGAKEMMSTCFGYQQILTPKSWDDMENWNLGTQLDVTSKEVWITKNKKKTARKTLNDLVIKVGGKMVRFDEGEDRTGGSCRNPEQLRACRAINNKPAGASEDIQLDYEREQLARELWATERINEVQKIGDREFMNLTLDYSLHAVVKAA